MKQLHAPDALISRLLAATTAGVTPDLFDEVNLLLAQFPVDPRTQYLGYIFQLNSGNAHGALDSLWRCLELNPKEKVFMQSVHDVIVRKDAEVTTKPTATDADQVQLNEFEDRPEYITAVASRYKYVARTLLEIHHVGSDLCGIDLSGNSGMLTRLIHNATGARMVGICERKEATENANRSHGNHRVVFIQQKLPTTLTSDVFDFAICFDSLERIADYETLIDKLFQTNVQTIFISAPSEDSLPLVQNKARLKSNRRHFSCDELSALCERSGDYSVQRVEGQLVYELDATGITGLLPTNRMYLRPSSQHAHFHILHLERKRDA
jgi:hypothetical protein